MPALVLTATLLMGGTAEGDFVSVSIRDNFFSPVKKKIQQGDNVTWANDGNLQHSTTSNTFLWDSGTLDSASNPSPMFPTFYAVDFPATGKYPYFCSIHGFTGTIVVPIKVAPVTGGTTTAFTVTWASAVPAGYVEDVQIKRPGATAFKDWKVGQTASSAVFTPDKGNGTYSFQARQRRLSNGATSSYSGARTITVS